MIRRIFSFNWLLCSLTVLLLLQSGYALSLIDNPDTRYTSPGKSLAATRSDKSRRLPAVPKDRPSADPIRFTLTCNKQQIAIGEPIVFTITAQLLDIPSNLMFFLPGATGYSLKLLAPEGFQQTESDLSELVSGELTYPTRATATYQVKGYFVSAADKTCFRLLRGSKQANAQSLFETKATLCLTTERGTPSPSSPKARAGAGSQASPPQLHVRSSLNSSEEDSTIQVTNAAGGCTSFAPVCSGNNQEVRTVTINVTTAGTYPLNIGYRAPEGSVDGIVRINGVSQNLRFSQTNAYATVSLPSVTLKAGDNTIGLSSGVNNGVGGGYLCFNSVCVSLSGGCTPPAPPTLSASTTQVCAGMPATLTASGCSGTVTWSSGQTTSSISVDAVGNYSATCTTNSCVSNSSTSLTLTACSTQPTPPAPPSQPTSSCTNFAQACSGNNQEVRTVTINVTTAGTYPLSIGYRSPEGTVEGILRINGVSQNLRFSQTNAYATLNLPSVTLKAGDNTIGLSSGVNNGMGGGYLCFNSVCVSLSGGCTPPAPPTLSASTTQVCAGTPATLTASGCSGTVTWSSGQTGNSISVSAVGTYSATCTADGCVSNSSTSLTLTACSTPPRPPAPPSQPTSSCTNFAQACSGNNQEVRTVTINVTTAGTYPLSIGYRSPEGTVEGILRINGVSQNLRFSQTNAYATLNLPSVTLKAGDNTIGLSSGVNNGMGGGYLCFNSVCVSLSGGCTPPAPPTLSASTTQVCAGTPATLTASGCSGTVTWSSGQTTSSISVSAVGTYSAICTTNNCPSTSSNSITLVTCLPSSASGCTSFAPVCSGNSQEMRTVTINVATAGSYPLNIGYRAPEGSVDGIVRINGVSQNLRFSQTNAYATVSLPSVTLKAGDNTIGLSSGVGGGYLCFNSVCTGQADCVPPAAPTLSASTTQVCPNNAATLTASGCSGTVNWSTGQTGNSIIVSSVGNYSATCTVSGCVSTPSRSLTLITCPALPVSGCTSFAPVCSGNNQEVRTIMITVAKAGNYPLTISYRSPESSVDGIVRINNVSQNLRFSQATSFVTLTIASVPLKEGENRIDLSSGNSSGSGGGYLCFNSVCAGNGGGCTPPAAPTVTASTTQVCPNTPAVLTASGCNGTITWSTGVTGNSINLNRAGTYSAICTTSDGCSGASSTPITLTTCTTPITGSCSTEDYSSETNITYKP